MAYSNDKAQIRAGLVNYIGALLKSSGYEGKVARQSVNAILAEEILKLGTDEDGKKELYSLRPLFKASTNALASMCKSLQEENTKESRAKLEEYKMLLVSLDSFIKNNIE